jgi:hypothetical protein
MDNVSVSLDDLDALDRALASGALPAADLLRSVVAAIRAVSGDEDSVTVSLEVVEPLTDTFEAAFTPEATTAASAGGQQFHMRFLKITR